MERRKRWLSSSRLILKENGGCGRKHLLFWGSLRASKRVAAIMSLIQSVKLMDHGPLAYLKDVLSPLLILLASRVG